MISDEVQDDVHGCTNVAMIWISKRDDTNAAGTGRPTRMWEVQIMQEHLSADSHGCVSAALSMDAESGCTRAAGD